MRKQAGFTLVEILMVVAILAILAAAIMPNFIGFDREAAEGATVTNLSALRAAVTLFRAKEGAYPGDLAALTTTTYVDQGATRAYIDAMPLNKIHKYADPQPSGYPDTDDPTQEVTAFDGEGGWVYTSTTAKVQINCNGTDLSGINYNAL